MNRHGLISILITAILLGISAALFFYLSHLDQTNVYKEFNSDIDRNIQQLGNEAERIQSTLKHWQSLYSNISNITADEFQRVAADVLESHSSLEVVAWSPIVPHAQRASIEAQLGKRFLSIPTPVTDSDQELKVFVNSFDIKQAEAAPERDFYLPILIAEPAELTSDFLGLDYLSLKRMGYNLNFQKVVQTGQVTALPVFPSVFSKTHEPIINIVVPVLDLRLQDQQLSQSVLLKGVINVVIPVEKILHASGFDALQSQASIIIRDISDSSQGVGLHRVAAIGEADYEFDSRAVDREFSMLGRDFSLVAQPSPDYLSVHKSFAPLIALIAGILISIIYLTYSLFLRRNENFVDEIVEERTKHLVTNNQQLNEANMQLEQLSRIDPLTGIDNRRAFDEISEKEWMRARRDKKSLVVLMIDVDHFKPYNDTYGHLKGDDCLKQVAQCIDAVCSRSSDLVARYGGEEFAVILPSSGPDAMRVAERCRAAVSALKIEHRMSESSDRVTISIGMSSVIPSDNASLALLIDSADRALYLAKVQGRNRVIYHTCLNHGSKMHHTS